MAALFAIAFIESNAAHADTPREKELEARIRVLEWTVQELVKRDNKLSKTQQAKTAKPVPEFQTKVADTPQGQAQPETKQQRKELSREDDTAKRDKPLPQPGIGTPGEAPQELNVIRDNTVTLKPRNFELSSEVNYIQNQTGIQRDRAVLNSTTFRYGVLDWLELSASIPVGYTTRTSDVSPVSSVTNHTSGLGDISAQITMRIVDQTNNWPGIVLALGFQAPTGADPYDFSLVRTVQRDQGRIPNPRNPLFDYFSQGSWVAHSNLQFYKTIDPVIVFAGIGLDHVYPYSATGYVVKGFNRFIYNFGFSLALSEKSTLGFSINGSYSPNIEVNSKAIFKTEQEPTFARVTFIQRIAKNWYLEPSMAFGLDADAPDYIIGLGVRARF